MKFMTKVITVLCIVAVLTLTSSQYVVAKNDKNKNFNDVDNGHWANDEIEQMVERGIINGYSNGNFEPDEAVTRAQFAKMLVLTLDLELIKPSTPSFDDVDKGHWAYKYVETAKYYLTGFKDSSTGDLRYKPDNEAVREDMAVAIVKGLGLEDDVDDDELEAYEDIDEISDNLYDYIAIAVEEEIMIGVEVEGEKYFNPQASLTRAEAAVLLSRLIDEEKVTFDEEKVTFNEDDVQTNEDYYDECDEEDEDDCEDDYYDISNMTPVLTSYIKENGIKLSWTQTKSKGFQYYKVVLSKSDSTPKYPDNGYAKYVADVSDIEYMIKDGQYYNGNEFDEIESGETYYISITACYDDGSRYTSNVIKHEMP